MKVMKRLTSLLLAASMFVAPLNSAHAVLGIGDVVYDPANYAQNLMTATRTLAMINNQITQIANETSMLINQAKNLQNLPVSIGDDLSISLGQIQTLMNKAKGIVYTISAVEAEFKTLYPDSYTLTLSTSQIAKDARVRWLHSRAAFRQSMLVQSQVVQGIKQDAVLLNQLVNRSQSAVGALQVEQAGNQLLALQIKQSLETQELMASQSRAVALEQARSALAEEQARVRFARFIGDGNAYTPLP